MINPETDDYFHEWLYNNDTTPRRSLYVGDQTTVSRTAAQWRHLLLAAFRAGYRQGVYDSRPVEGPCPRCGGDHNWCQQVSSNEF